MWLWGMALVWVTRLSLTWWHKQGEGGKPGVPGRDGVPGKDGLPGLSGKQVSDHMPLTFTKMCVNFIIFCTFFHVLFASFFSSLPNCSLCLIITLCHFLLGYRRTHRPPSIKRRAGRQRSTRKGASICASACVDLHVMCSLTDTMLLIPNTLNLSLSLYFHCVLQSVTGPPGTKGEMVSCCHGYITANTVWRSTCLTCMTDNLIWSKCNVRAACTWALQQIFSQCCHTQMPTEEQHKVLK